MDFTIEKETLLSALTTLSKINPTRTTLPILSTVFIKTHDNGMVGLRSTDLEVEMEIGISAKVLESGETCAPVYKLLEIANSITEETISINVNETQRMRIKTSTGKYLLMCSKTEEFPDQREFIDEPKKMSADGLITIASDWQSDQVPVKTYAAYGDYNSENFPYSDPDTITWQSAAASQQHVPTADDTATFWMSLFSWGVPGSRMAVKFGMTNICMPEFSDKPA